MPNPITLTEPEDQFLQSILTERYQNDCIRSLEGPLFLSLLNQVKTWPAAITFTEQEDRRLQVLLEGLVELLTPYPYPYSPLTFGQDTQQLSIIKSILTKLEAAR